MTFLFPRRGVSVTVQYPGTDVWRAPHLLPALLVAAPLSRRNYAPEFSSPELRHFTQHRKLQRVAANAL